MISFILIVAEIHLQGRVMNRIMKLILNMLMKGKEDSSHYEMCLNAFKSSEPMFNGLDEFLKYYNIKKELKKSD